MSQPHIIKERGLANGFMWVIIKIKFKVINGLCMIQQINFKTYFEWNQNEKIQPILIVGSKFYHPFL